MSITDSAVGLEVGGEGLRLRPNRATQPISPEATRTDEEGSANGLVEHDDRMVVTPSAAIALAGHTGEAPGVRGALDQRDRMEQDIPRAWKFNVSTGFLDAPRRSLPPVLALEMPIEHNGGYARPSA